MSELEIKWFPLEQVALWDKNSKIHNLNGIAESIIRYGFQHPPVYDQNLNDGAGGIAAGNGRTVALKALFHSGQKVPKNIKLDSDGGWLVPVIVGLDAKSISEAMAYAIDDNNLTVNEAYSAIVTAQMYESGYVDVLSLIDEKPITVSESDLADIIAEAEKIEIRPVYITFGDYKIPTDPERFTTWLAAIEDQCDGDNEAIITEIKTRLAI